MPFNISARLSAIISDLDRMDFAEEIAAMISRRGREMSSNEMIKALQSAIKEIEAEDDE